MNQPSALLTHRPVAVLGWAAFLACSWTWCIGMFLPVILLRDYGTLSWIIFALPNVIGAAAMGWVLQRPGASEKMVHNHAPAMSAFSVVTILFHVLFVFWVVRWLGGWALVIATAGAAILAFPLLLSRFWALVLSAIVLAGSVTAFIVAVSQTAGPSIPAGHESIDLLYLAPVCLVGFALCPYLDLTFHRARQALTPYGSVAAFTLGFGVMFLTMIVFTLWYGPMTVPPDAMREDMVNRSLPRIAALAVVLHMTVQAGFTVAAHSVEIMRRLRQPGPPAHFGMMAGLIFSGSIFVLVWNLAQGTGYQGLSGFEVGYRLFLSFYALVSPAYIWLFVVPWRARRPSLRALWITLLVTTSLGGAAFWMGFIEDRMVWLLPGVGIILISRGVVSAFRPRVESALADASLT